MDAANVGILLSLLGVLITTTWKMATLVGKFQALASEFAKHVEYLPIMKRDQEQANLVLSKTVSDVRELKTQVEIVKARAEWTGSGGQIS